MFKQNLFSTKGKQVTIVSKFSHLFLLFNTIFFGSSLQANHKPPCGNEIMTKVYHGLVNTSPYKKGTTWNISCDNELTFKNNEDWLLATPTDPWGKTYRQFHQAKTCHTNSFNCNRDFNLVRCTTDRECGPQGVCQKVMATKKGPFDAAERLCVGHSYKLYESIYNLMIKAEKLVDIATLDLIDGRFLSTFRNALSVLSKKGKPIKVRILVANYAFSSKELRAMLNELTRDIDGFYSPIEVKLGLVSWATFSWNHAKIIAVDGKASIVGGHNWKSSHYLDKYPVHDVSMQFAGSSTFHAHQYLDNIWQNFAHKIANNTVRAYGAADQYLLFNKGQIIECIKSRRIITSKISKAWINSEYKNICINNLIDSFTTELSETSGPRNNVNGLPIISIGSLGDFDTRDTNDSRDAIHNLIKAAKKDIYISQMAIGPLPVNVSRFMSSGLIKLKLLERLGITPTTLSWPAEFLDAIATAITKHTDETEDNAVHVYLVISHKNAVGAGLKPTEAGYYGDELRGVITRLFEHMKSLEMQKPNPRTDWELRELINQRFHVAAIRYSSDSRYPGDEIANHAKSVLVDKEVFYVGSQNLYLDRNSEFGYIMDLSSKLANPREKGGEFDYYERYFKPLWNYSKASKVRL